MQSPGEKEFDIFTGLFGYGSAVVTVATTSGFLDPERFAMVDT
jgi:hypothetical protein